MNTTELVSELSKQDVYAVMCSFLYDLRQVPEYSTLSELCYLLDPKSFQNLINYFGGKTFRVPSKEELKDCVQVLRLFQYYEVEHRPWKDAVVLAGFPTSSGKSAKNKLEKLKETMEQYNFGNRCL